MARVVRNFWIDLSVDGRSSDLSGGPRSKDGGISGTIYIRDEGGIRRAVELSGLARSDGTLVLEIEPARDYSGTFRVHSERTENGGFRIVTAR
jgi:hypothetical protein